MANNVITKSPKAKRGIASPKLDMQDAVSCALSFEKCKGGFQIRCCCDDSMECADLQALCETICEGKCTCCCVRDGNQICNFNLCCNCKCENTKDGCCITCISGNAKDCEMLQACCDCLECCCQTGGCCYVCFGVKCCCFGGCNS